MDNPIRIQRSRKKGWRMPPNTVYVGRPSKWCNPFSVEEYGRSEAVRLYKDLWSRADEGEIERLKRDLKGKNLACWCRTFDQCHADILISIVNDAPLREVRAKGYKCKKRGRFIRTTETIKKMSDAKIKYKDLTLHTVYRQMKNRCYNKNTRGFKDYGGRGIKVCDRWLAGYQNFYDDMFPTYKKGLTLERINNDRGYSPENCKWATPKEQKNNTRRNVFIVYKGIRKTISQWADSLKIDYRFLYVNVRQKGLSIEQVINSTKS